MPHPSETDLALYAGNDLGRMARLRVDWHLRTCGKCQQEVTEFSSLRADTMRGAPEPEVNWDRLAAEMKANIRLGLAAGECITPVPQKYRTHSPWAWATLVAAGLITVAAGSSVWLNHSWSEKVEGAGSTPTLASVAPDLMLEFTSKGIQFRNGEVTNELQNNNRGSVENSISTQGVVASTYIDRDTGVVTTNCIYGQ